MLVEHNPGLEKFELSDYRGIAGTNYYRELPLLRDFIKSSIPAADMEKVEAKLTDFGGLCAGAINDLVIAAHQEGKYGRLQKFDRHGNRIDEILYSREQTEAKKLAHEAGLADLQARPEWKIPYHYEHREAMAYLSNLNGEAGINCPLAMTEGMINILSSIGTDEQKKKFLPKVAGPGSEPFAAGQYLTERVGGSNVGKNRTIARRREDGKYELIGEKWFCSNPSELWVTTAKLEGTETIGAFFVPRYRDDGSLNEHHILRLKDIIGSRGKVTAEVEYRGTEAELIGRPHTGLALLMKYVISISRIHVTIAATAMSRRAFWEARAYSRKREAYNRKIGEFASIRRSLAEMQSRVCALELCLFTNWGFHRDEHPVFELFTPVLKARSTRESTEITHEAIMIHGGNGILSDYSVLPRLHNDCIINETWEGTHNIIAGHAWKALRKPKIRTAFFAFLEESAKVGSDEYHAELKKRSERLSALNLTDLSEANRLALVDRVYEVMALAVFLRTMAKATAADKKNLTEIAACFLESIEIRGDFLPDSSTLLNHELLERVIAYS